MNDSNENTILCTGIVLGIFVTITTVLLISILTAKPTNNIVLKTNSDSIEYKKNEKKIILPKGMKFHGFSMTPDRSYLVVKDMDLNDKADTYQIWRFDGMKSQFEFRVNVIEVNKD